MRKFALYLILLVLLLPFRSVGQDYIFKVTKNDTVQKDFKRVLIVGIGLIETRMFLDNLSTKVIKALMADKIEAEYYHLGKSVSEANIGIKQLLNQYFNAVLVFSPIDSLHNYELSFGPSYDFYDPPYPALPNQFNNNKLGVVIPRPPIRSIKYEDNFNIQLYDIQNQKTLIWSATLKVDFNLVKASIYKEVSELIISSLKTNKVLK